MNLEIKPLIDHFCMYSTHDYPHKMMNSHTGSRLMKYITLCRTRYVGKCSSVGHDVRFERVVMVRGLKSCDNFFGSFGTLGLYSSEGEITPKKVGTIVYYISWMLNISFTDSYWMHVVLFQCFFVGLWFVCGWLGSTVILVLWFV